MLEQFLNYLRITDGIASSDVISWVFAIFGGFMAYLIIDHMQTSMERHSMLHSVEQDFSNLYDSVIALSANKSSTDSKNCELEGVMLRSVLHDFSDWVYSSEENAKKIIKSQRYLRIRDGFDKTNKTYYHEWISTQALHEIVIQSRRIEKMYKDGIIKRIDLADMFHELVPLGCSGRIQFLESYYGEYDAECIGYLVMQVIVSCERYNNEKTVRSFVNYYKEHEEIHKYFTDSRRNRKIRDAYARYKFKKIVERY